MADENASVSINPRMANYIVAAVVALLVGIFVVIAITSSASGENKTYALDADKKENVVMSEARLAAALGAYDGSGKITEDDCNTLGEIAKKYNEDANWFSRCANTLRAATPDTDQNNILKLSDGNYCATFTLDKDNRVLTGYSFKEEVCGDALIEVV